SPGPRTSSLGQLPAVRSGLPASGGPKIAQIPPPGRAEAPEPERAVAVTENATPSPVFERETVESPVSTERSAKAIHIARAEERPMPPPAPEVKEMHASNPGTGAASYTMEAKSSLDLGAVASLADLRRSMQHESEEE